MDLNKETRIQLNDIDLTSSNEKETFQNRITKVDKVADQIINAFIVKPKERMIDQEDQNDNISYEESEVRLIFMGITSATLLASISMILSIMALQNNSSIRLQIRPPTKDAKMKFLSPYVTFMHLGGEGHLFTLKQNPDANFKYDWELKLPRVPEDTGYFVFNDRNAIFVISSNSNQKMTMINGPNQHVTLAKSHIIDNFYFFGSILRVGNFAMVFGGMDQLPSDNIVTNGCTLNTALWSIKRQRWIQGPDLPPKILGCSSISTGFALNKTNVMVLFWEDLYTDMFSFFGPKDACIDAYTFSFDTFQWNFVKKCLLTAENIPIMRSHTILTCTTYYDKFSRLYVDIFIIIKKSSMFHDFCRKILILWYELDDYKHIRTFLLDYSSMVVKQLKDPTMLKAKQNCINSPGITIFTLRNQVYLTTFQESMVEIFEFDENANESFVMVQQMNLKPDLLEASTFHISATPLWK